MGSSVISAETIPLLRVRVTHDLRAGKIFSRRSTAAKKLVYRRPALRDAFAVTPFLQHTTDEDQVTGIGAGQDFRREDPNASKRVLHVSPFDVLAGAVQRGHVRGECQSIDANPIYKRDRGGRAVERLSAALEHLKSGIDVLGLRSSLENSHDLQHVIAWRTIAANSRLSGCRLRAPIRELHWGQRKTLSRLATLRDVSCAGGKSMDPNERAEKAAQVAFNALSMAQAYGILVESLIGVLKDSRILKPGKLEQVFRGAAAIIDQATPADRAQGMAQANMRQIIERAAQNAGIEISPLGQPGMPRSH
jgi:hypothetical protein